MKTWPAALLMVAGLMSCNTSVDPTASATSIEPKTGIWRAVFQSPGGDLPFRLEISGQPGTYRATIGNGEETLELDQVAFGPAGEVTLGFQHYESVIHGQLDSSGSHITGTWMKVVAGDRFAKLTFHADYGYTTHFPGSTQTPPAQVAGRWAVTFHNQEDAPEPAIAEFQQEGGHLTGTFLTETGDYRYLEGNVDGNTLALSCFDGGHAFLFKARLDEQGRLNGDFWSSDNWHQSWTAGRDETATLADAYQMTYLDEGISEFRFEFPDLDGRLMAQDDARLQGKVRIIVIFGSWCPNCNDEAPFLEELYKSYGERGLEIVGLAFEATGNEERDRKVLDKFRKRHGLTYPILLAGTRDKGLASAKLPDLNRVIAYPTSIFIDRQGKVTSIHTGFSGPATGDHYHTLKQEFRDRIEAML